MRHIIGECVDRATCCSCAHTKRLKEAKFGKVSAKKKRYSRLPTDIERDKHHFHNNNIMVLALKFLTSKYLLKGGKEKLKT